MIYPTNTAGSVVYPNAVTNVPREIGYLTRVEGLGSALAEIDTRLANIHNTIDGMPTPPSVNQTPQISGLRATLERAEDNVRAIMNRLEQLSSAL